MTTRAQQHINKLTKPKRGYNTLKFPLDIETEGTGDIMLININIPEGSRYLGTRYTQTGDRPANRDASAGTLRRKVGKQNVRIDSAVALFIPNGLTTSYQSDWSTSDLGSIGAIADAFTGIGELSWESAESAWKTGKQSVGDVVTNTIAGAVQALTPLNIQDAKNLVTNQISNPYIEVLFNGVQNRTFSFTFKMVPKSAREAIEVKKIIDELKFHRAPEVKYSNQNNYWLFPSTFDIKFINRGSENPWLFKISTCALTNVEIDYITEGAWVTHTDGSPFGYSMTLHFTELEQLTKQRILEGY